MNTIAIIGRPNVGKSSLFNRLLKERRAIVDIQSGITRDRVYGVTERDEKPMVIIDTGGLQFSGDEMSNQIKKQVDFAIDEADIIILMVDGIEGLNPLDKEISDYIRKTECVKILAINKMDKGNDWRVLSEFSSIVLDITFQISAMHGSGLEKLLDYILKNFEEGEIISGTTIGIIGKPNTGKSTFVNSIMGYERSIIKEEPGTTRDSINSYLEFNDENITLVDTAGLKRKVKIKGSIEYYSFLRAIRTIEESDIVLILIDSTKKISRQDMRIINWAMDRETPLIILLSKFDLIPKNREKEVIQYYKKKLYFWDWIPVIPISSLEMMGVDKAILTALNIKSRISKEYEEIKEIIKKACSKRPPPGVTGQVKIYEVEQEAGRIWIKTNHPKYFDRNYKKYLENRIRRNLQFSGIPISIIAKRH